MNEIKSNKLIDDNTRYVLVEPENIQLKDAEDDIDLRELWSAIWQGKWLILAVSVLFAFASVLYALSLPNIYKSEVLLAPAEENQGGGLSGLASQFGGLASLAGVNLGSGGTDKTRLALEVLKSRAFLGKFVADNNFTEALMATKGWDLSTNTLKYDEEIYDLKNHKWVRDATEPRTPEPSELEVHKYVLKHVLSVVQDKETGFVTIAVKHYSPYVAKEIVHKLVFALNQKIKQDDIAEAEKSIRYLNQAISETPNSEMRNVFYQLIEKQQQTKMLANIRDQYVLKVIDPPVISEEKDSPKRALICVLGMTLGAMLSILWVLVRYFYNRGLGKNL